MITLWWPLPARTFAFTCMRSLLIAVAVVLCGTPVMATSLAAVSPNPLIYASVIRLEMGIGGEHLFYGQPGRWRVFTEQVRVALALRLEAAGIELEARETVWQQDRAKYWNTGAPHYHLWIFISGRNASEETGGAIDYGFIVDASLEAELLTPELDSEETFSTRRMGFATDADLETRIRAELMQVFEEILDPEAGQHPLEKETRRLPDVQLSLDLTPPGHGDLLTFYRGQIDDLPAQAALFTEPREGNTVAEPIATFSLIGYYPPAQVLAAAGGRYLVTIHRHVGYQPDPHIVIYRTDGSIVRRLTIHDLLTEEDRKHSASLVTGSHWTEVRHSIDHDRGRLVFSLPTGDYFGGSPASPADRVARIEIDLETGLAVHPSRDYLPRREPRVALTTIESESGVTRFTPGASLGREPIGCREGWTPDPDAFAKAKQIPRRNLLADAVWLPMPRYTEIGRKARITGRVELELLIAESGEVVCVGVTKMLPMGLSDEALKATLGWRLAPLPEAQGPARGQVTFDFDIVEIQPPPY